MIYDYIVIILNYNASEFIHVAIESIRKCAIASYMICVVDNNSSRKGEKEKIIAFKAEDVEVLLLDENSGYGKGNNEAVRYMSSQYKFRYIVIMNPDIEIIAKGTIEGIIENANKEGAIGGQPLVWNFYYSEEPKTQINIGRAVDFKGLCLQSNLFLRILFKKNFRELMFLNDMPYESHIKYQMPSGAFFIIYKDVFEEIQGFDEDTFLYGEESIIAHKLCEKDYYLLFNPEYVVKHLQGATTGYDRYRWDKRRLSYMKQSRNIFVKKYLKHGKFHVIMLNMLLNLDFMTRKIYVMFKRKRKTQKYGE